MRTATEVGAELAKVNVERDVLRLKAIELERERTALLQAEEVEKALAGLTPEQRAKVLEMAGEAK